MKVSMAPTKLEIIERNIEDASNLIKKWYVLEKKLDSVTSSNKEES
jgi:hypothetical protein